MGRRRVVKCRVAGSRHYTATLISVVLALVWTTALLTSPGAGLVPGAGIVHSGAAARLKPHIVLVLVDDARADDLRPAFMPRSNALIARHGTRFTRFYAPFPLCCPARATLLTGQYSHNHGVVNNQAPSGFAAFRDRHSLATWLTPTYRTAMIGKYLNGYGDNGSETYVPPGWDRWIAPLEGSVYNYTDFQVSVDGVVQEVHEYSTDYYGDQAVAFVADAVATDVPLFLYLSLVAPHDGRPHTDDVGRLLSPYVDPRFRDTYSGPSLPEDPSFNELDVSDKNPGIAGRARLTDVQIAYLKEKLAQRRESLRSVDRQVARVLGVLSSAGELDNTYVFLLSDNGFMLGEHRILHDKKHLYEPTVRIPLQVRGPGIPAGRHVSVPTAQVDLAPTLLHIAGISKDPQTLGLQVDGRSLLGALDNEAPPRPIVLEEHTPVTPADPGRWIRRGLTTARFSYLRFPGPRTFEEVYDLRVDPHQQVNLAARPAYQDVVRRLRKQWNAYKACSGRECRARP
jgi:arylsulfatase A-like enzyme